MAFSAGNFSRLYNWVDDKNNGIKINATRMDAEMDGMATGLSTCLLKDGTQTVTANIPMATFKFTGLGSGSAATDSANLGQVQSRATAYAVGAGSANAQTLTLSPAITAYAAGQSFNFTAGATNTGATTLAVNGLTAKSIKKLDGATALTAGDIVSGGTYRVTYDGTNFVLSSTPKSLSLAGTLAVTGAVTLSSTLGVTGTLTGAAITGTNITASGTLTGATAAGAMVATSVQAQAETAGKLLTADLSKYPPYAVKAFCSVASNGSLASSGYGVTASGQSSTGVYTVGLDSSYIATPILPMAVMVDVIGFIRISSFNSTTVTVRTYNSSGAAADAQFVFYAVSTG